jgi:hypothetical protein
MKAEWPDPTGSPSEIRDAPNPVASASIVGFPDEILIAWTWSGSKLSRAMQDRWGDGSFTQKAQSRALFNEN